MQTIKKIWLKQRIAIFIMDMIIALCGLCLYTINKQKFFDVIYSPLPLSVILIIIFINFYPQILKSLISKYCDKDTAEVIVPKNEDIDKIKQDIKQSAIANTTKKNSQKLLKKTENTELKNLFDDLKAKRYEKVILRIKNKLKTSTDINYNILLEVAYSEQDVSDYDIQERIKNLSYIIESDTPYRLKINFILSYIGCNLFVGSYNLVEKVIYDTLSKALIESLDPFVFCKLHQFQMNSFVLQNRISEALASGKKALQYADNKDRCFINFNLSKIYFYFLNDIKLSLYYALDAWNDIYKEAGFIKELVQLCYIMLFFDGQIEAACNFLANFTANEKDDSYKDNLSYLLYKKGDIKNAKNNALYCLKQNPKEAIASINTLAMIQKDKKDYEGAIYKFSEAITGLQPNRQHNIMKRFWLEALYNRATCYIKLSNYTKAKEDMDIVIKEQYDAIDEDVLREYYELSIVNIDAKTINNKQ